MKRLFLSIITIPILAYSALSCSLKANYLSEFNKTEYVFIGKVIGYTDQPLEFKRNIPEEYNKGVYKYAYGLIVKVKESVNLPKTPKSHFEVFPFDLDSACNSLGVKASKLQQDFPLNSEILVVVEQATLFPHILENGNFRLEKKFARSNVIALNKDKDNKPLTNATSILEYIEPKIVSDFEDKYFLFDFEARKDLKRLQESNTKKEKDEAINILIKNPTRSINFFELLRLNLKSKQEILELFEKRLRFENEYFSKIYGKPYYSEEKIQDYLNRIKKELEKTKNIK